MSDPAGETRINEKKALEGTEKRNQFHRMEAIEISNSDSFSSPSIVVRRGSFTNLFAAKKTVAQGMMDIALITANANQLRYLLEYCSNSNSFYIIFGLIVASLCLQVVVGVFLIFKGRSDIRREKSKHAVRVNNCILVGVFLITVINVFISAFSATA